VKKVSYLFREMLSTIKRHKAWFMAPILLTLATLSFLIYYLGPSFITSFIYAGF
jgi:Family of unknown function (DUF5989)